MNKTDSFDLRFYDAISLIAFGKGSTSGRIADLIGAYGFARQVGCALCRLSLPFEFPWQSIVNAKGQPSRSSSRKGTDWIQITPLTSEGILISNFTLSLRKYLWIPEVDHKLSNYVDIFLFGF